MTTTGVAALANNGPAFWALEAGYWFSQSQRYFLLERITWKLHCWWAGLNLQIRLEPGLIRSVHDTSGITTLGHFAPAVLCNFRGAPRSRRTTQAPNLFFAAVSRRWTARGCSRKPTSPCTASWFRPFPFAAAPVSTNAATIRQPKSQLMPDSQGRASLAWEQLQG